MSISLMLLASAAVLSAAGIGERTLREYGMTGRHILFFLLCIAVMNTFQLHPSENVYVSAACLLCTVWTFGNAFGANSECKMPFMLIPVSLTASLAAPWLNEYSAVVLMIAAAAAVLVFGVSFGIAFGGTAPVLAVIWKHVFSTLNNGYEMLEITEECLVMQLVCIISAAAFGILIERRRYNTVVLKR